MGTRKGMIYLICWVGFEVHTHLRSLYNQPHGGGSWQMGTPYADCAGVPVCIPTHTGSPYAQFAYGDPIYIRETEPVCTLVLPVYKLGPN